MRNDLTGYDFGMKTTEVAVDTETSVSGAFTYVHRWWEGATYCVIIFLNQHGIYELYGNTGETVATFTDLDSAITAAIPFLQSEIESRKKLDQCA